MYNMAFSLLKLKSVENRVILQWHSKEILSYGKLVVIVGSIF